jgi:hypothetical protein
LHPAFKSLDDDHAATAAWAGRPLIFTFAGCTGLWRRCRRNSKQFARMRDICFATAAGEQAVVADAVETLWQDMQKKAADDQRGGPVHRLCLAQS